MRRLLAEMEREKCAKVTFEENRTYTAVKSVGGILKGVTITCKNLIKFVFSIPGRTLSYGMSTVFGSSHSTRAIQMERRNAKKTLDTATVKRNHMGYGWGVGKSASNRAQHSGLTKKKNACISPDRSYM